MKKGILFALAALCVSAVQAVTINWTVESPTYAGATGHQWLGVALIAGDVDYSSIVIDYNVGGPTLTVSSPTAGVLGTTLMKITSTNGADNGPADTSAVSGQFTNITLSGVEKLSLVFVAPYQYKDEGKKGALNYATFDLSKLDYTFGDTADITIESFAINGLEGSAVAATGSASIVPEPTALALLALGVAGLALRRKA